MTRLKLRNILVVLLLLGYGSAFCQIKPQGTNDQAFPTFYQQRSSLFRLLPVTKNDIIFLGNSITNGSEWDELFGDPHIKNRGISGDVTAGVLNRLDEVTARKPAKIFLLIGINDLAAGRSPDSVALNIFSIAERIKLETPSTRLYVQSILPVNNAFNKFPNHVNKGEQIKQLNLLLKESAAKYNYTFIDLYPSFCNAEGKLDTANTNDGLHEKGTGYMLWKHLIYPYVYDLQSRPSLLPKPQKVEWSNDNFPLYKCHFIVVKDSSLKSVAAILQESLLQKGLITKVIYHSVTGNEPVIILEQKTVNTPGVRDEAYQLTVNNSSVNIVSNTSHGCFNALQTLEQLMHDNDIIPGVTITDYPVFAWRGYMVDVGRNYQPIAMLKQQIEVMAKYKLNVFHLHLTEDIAWRLEIKQYPQLAAAPNMLRNTGAYYSVDELKDLITYCKDRYITLIPEIDMPGHSAAFRRAFNCDMQSDSGIRIVKNILKEICTTYAVPYLHIGGDEVKITNSNFLPEITSYIHALGKQTIGWSPGGNLDKETIHQLWMKEGAVDPQIKYIDSRNLYINHMDPLESVPSIFNRKIGDTDQETTNMLGATLCLWPDRNVTRQEDILTMNPVYPAMLTFAERSWRGGGADGWHANILNADVFSEFENRLTDQQKQYFANIPFSYIAQSAIKWNLYGPYANKGNVNAVFPPEKKGFKTEKVKYEVVTGGTVILRHFWYPEVKAVLPQPQDSATYYAISHVWSARDTTALMWIGFYNISRSATTATPNADTWDDRGSAIWLNDNKIPPPLWSRAGEKDDLERPLTDEGYEYRAPTIVHLKKGWNKLLIKLPVRNFRSGENQNPVKWMFTAVFVKPLGVNFIADDEYSHPD